MNIKSIFKAIGKACLYFGIYFGWQLMVTNWAAIIASVIVSLRMAADPSGALSETIGAAAESASPDASPSSSCFCPARPAPGKVHWQL